MLNFGPFWPYLALLWRIYTLFGALYTGQNTAVVPQSWQIWGMNLAREPTEITHGGKRQPERAIMWKVQEDEADLNTGHQSREELCQKKSWNFVSIDREMPPWRAAVVFSKIVLKLIENCTWKREETNVLKVKSERKPAEKKLLKIAIAEQRRQKSSFWNIETSYCFYLATFSVPKWKRAKEPTKSSHGRRIS